MALQGKGRTVAESYMHMLEYVFLRQYHTERMLAIGRVVLAGAALIALRLDPAEPPQYAPVASVLAVAYTVYAFLIALLVWRLALPHPNLRRITYVGDLLVCFVLMYFTTGPMSPFFVCFVFSLLCATLYWQWRGVLWTAVVILAAFMASGIYAGGILADPAFELNRFILRGVHLMVVAAALGYLGAHQ